LFYFAVGVGIIVVMGLIALLDGGLDSGIEGIGIFCD
jgi:hypothetical protein